MKNRVCYALNRVLYNNVQLTRICAGQRRFFAMTEPRLILFLPFASKLPGQRPAGVRFGRPGQQTQQTDRPSLCEPNRTTVRYEKQPLLDTEWLENVSYW